MLWRRCLTKIDNIIWWFKHRFTSKYKYYMIDTGLPPGYYDPDIRIKHAIFRTTCKYFENTRDSIGWDSSEGHKKAYNTLKEVHEYWKKGGERDALEEIQKKLNIEFDSEKFMKIEDIINKKDKEHMHKIVDIINYMWYP